MSPKYIVFGAIVSAETVNFHIHYDTTEYNINSYNSTDNAELIIYDNTAQRNIVCKNGTCVM